MEFNSIEMRLPHITGSSEEVMLVVVDHKQNRAEQSRAELTSPAVQTYRN